MHLIFYLRGIKPQLDLWVTMAQGLYWKWDRISMKTRKTETIIVQGALRPSILGAYEYIFPEEALPEVLAMLGIDDKTTGCKDEKKSRVKLAFMRKILGAKKIPKEALKAASKIQPSVFFPEGTHRAFNRVNVPGVAIHPVGIRLDERRDFSELGYNQEAL